MNTPTNTTSDAARRREEALVAWAFQDALGGAEDAAADSQTPDPDRLARTLRELTGVSLDADDLSGDVTVAGVAALLAARRRDDAVGDDRIPRASDAACHPMSPAQRRIFLACQLDGPGVVYNMPSGIEFDGAIDPDRARAAVRALMARHDVLRASFHADPDADDPDLRFVQRLVAPADLATPLSVRPLTDSDDADDLLADFVAPFDLSRAPLFRVGLAVGQGRSVVIFDAHHIVCDAVSAQVLRDEFCALYTAAPADDPPADGVSYVDYVHWARGRDLSQQRQFWLDAFADPVTPLDLAPALRRPPRRRHDGAAIRASGGAGLRARVEAFALERGATPFMVMLAAYAALLGAYADQDDVTVGCPMAGRLHRDVERVVGMFVNTIPLRVRVRRDLPFDDLVAQVREFALAALQHQDYPYEELVEALDLPRDPSRNPLFDAVFAYQSPVAAPTRLDGLTWRRDLDPPATAKFDLSLEAAPTDVGYAFTLSYATSLLRPDTAERLLARFVRLLDAAATHPQRGVRDLVLASPDDPDPRSFNHPAPPTAGQSLVGLFDAQAALRPDHPALVWGERQLSYGQLRARAERVAAQLAGMGVRRGDIVAIWAGRGFGLTTTMLGAMKAGAAFLPIDAATPAKRCAYMLADSHATALCLADAELGFDTGLPVLRIDDEDAPDADVAPPGPGDAAYCIYTSGTTGAPKGVLLGQDGLVTIHRYAVQELGIGPDDTVLQFASCAFDACVWEHTLALTTGAALRVLPAGAATDPDQLGAALAGVTIAAVPPQLVPELPASGLRILMTAGSAASPETVRLVEAGNGMYLNGYGPTEATICASVWRHEPGAPIPDPVPVGRPLPGAPVYVLDGLTPCPVEIPGEICVGGAGVGRGYLNRPELTDAVFVANPFGPGRIYRTGDHGYWRPDGDLVCLGRVDDQVKIRGFRVELGEVATTLLGQPGVRQAAAVVRDGELVGYLGADASLDLAGVRAGLAAFLPDYMVPTRFVVLDELPLTASGKPDASALPAPTNSSARHRVGPRDAAERLVAGVFADALGLSAGVDVHDGFFALGGDSIKVIRMVSRFRDAGYAVSAQDVMERQTVAAVAAALTPLDAATSSASPDGQAQPPVEGAVPLSPVQVAFFATGHARPEHYNQAVMVRFAHPVDDGCLREALTLLVRSHDMLRATYPGGRQTVLPVADGRFPLDVVDLRGGPVDLDEVARRGAEVQASFDLETGPLTRAVLHHGDDADHLLLVAHHLVVDAFSWSVLVKDLLTAYRRGLSGTEPALPPRTASFRDWAGELAVYADIRARAEELPHWLDVLDRVGRDDGCAHGPIDPPFERTLLSVGTDLVEQLVYEAGRAYDTKTDDLLLAAFALARHRQTGAATVCVEVESQGRTGGPHHLNLDRTVGWFTCTYPVVFDVSDDVGATVRQVRQTLRDVPQAGVGHGLLQARGAFGDHPARPRFGFNYLGDEDAALAAFDQDAAASGVAWSDWPTGPMSAQANRQPTLISLDGGIRHGRLTLTITHAASVRDEVADFVKAYQDALADVVAHCVRTAARRAGPALREDELAALAALLDGAR